MFHSCIWPSAGIAIATELLYVLGSNHYKTTKHQTERLKNDKPKVEYNKPLTGNIRDTLKEMMQKEIESLPDTLKELGCLISI